MKEELARKIMKDSAAGYEKIAEQFSRTRSSFWKELDFIKKEISEGDNVLDLGCGNGRLYEFLKDKKIDYTGVDSSEGLLKLAREKYGETAKFVKGDALNLPFADESFDKIVSIAVLHHIPSKESRKKFLSEARRVLKKDGLLIISVWNMRQRKYAPLLIKNAFLKLIGLSALDFGDAYLGWNKEKNVRFLHAFGKREFKKLLEESGFSVERLAFVKRKSGQGNLLAIVEKREN